MMGSIQEVLEECLAETFSTEKIFCMLFQQYLCSAGIELTDEQMVTLFRDAEKMLSTGVIELDLSSEQMNSARLHGEADAQVLIQKLVHEMSADLPNFEEKFTEAATSALSAVFPLMGQTAFEEIRSNLKRHKRNLIRQRKAQRQDVISAWGPALDAFDFQLSLSNEALEMASQLAMKTSDVPTNKLESLILLATRGCQVAAEIITLLRAGFPNGATARWRSLHEISVTAAFLTQHDESLSTRFLDYENICCLRLACAERRYTPSMRFDNELSAQISQLRVREAELKREYGEVFVKGDYGWAAKHIQLDDVKFSDLERSVQLEIARPKYRLASAFIHPNVWGISRSIGLEDPSDYAAIDFAHVFGTQTPLLWSSWSLLFLITELLCSDPHVDGVVMANVLKRMNEVVTREIELVEIQFAGEEETTETLG
jgi:hypothetical protein